MCLLHSLPSQSVLSAPACLGGQQPPRPLSSSWTNYIMSSRSEGINGSKARASPGTQLHVPGARVPQGRVPGVQGEKLPPAGMHLLALPCGAQHSQPLWCQQHWPLPHLQRRIRFTLGHSGRSVLKLGRTGNIRCVILLGKTQQWVPSPMTS